MGRRSVVTQKNQEAVAGAGGGNEDDGDGVLKNQSVKKYSASTTKGSAAEATAEKIKVPVVEDGSLLVEKSTRRSQRLQNVTSSSGDFGIRSELKRVEVVLGSGGGGDAGGGVAVLSQATLDFNATTPSKIKNNTDTISSTQVKKTRGRPRKHTVEAGVGVAFAGQTTLDVDATTTSTANNGNDLSTSVNLGGGDAGGGVAIPSQATLDFDTTTASKIKNNNDTTGSAQVKKTRGRPRKHTVEGGDGAGIPNQTTLSFNPTLDDSSYTVGTDQIKKKRGRPRKDTIEAGVGVAFAGPTTLDFDATTTSTTNNGNYAISSDQVDKKRGRPRKDTAVEGGGGVAFTDQTTLDFNTAASTTSNDNHAISSDHVNKKKRGRPRKYSVEGGGRVEVPDQTALNLTTATTLNTSNDNLTISTDLVKKNRGRPRKYTVQGCGDIVRYPTPLCSVPPTPQQSCSSTTPYSSEPPAQQLDTLESGGIAFTPHVLAVEAGEAVSNNPSSIANDGTIEPTADLTEKAIGENVSLRKTKLRRSSKRLQKALSCTQDSGSQSELGHVIVGAEGCGVEAELEGGLKDQSVDENSSSIAKDGNMDVTKELTEVALLENGSGQETKSTERTQQLPHATSPTRDYIPSGSGRLEVVLEVAEGSLPEAGQDFPQNPDAEEKDSEEIERVHELLELAAAKSFSLQDVISMTEIKHKEKVSKYKNLSIDAEKKVRDLQQENSVLTKKLECATTELQGLRELRQENQELTRRLAAADAQLQKNRETVSGAIEKLREAFPFSTGTLLELQSTVSGGDTLKHSTQTKPPPAKRAKFVKGDKSSLEGTSK